MNHKILAPFLPSLVATQTLLYFPFSTRVKSFVHNLPNDKLAQPVLYSASIGKYHRENLYSTTSKQNRICYFRLYSKRKDGTNNDLLNTLFSPFDIFWKVISFPIGGGRGRGRGDGSSNTSTPLLYPLTILLFNIIFNNTTSIILDAFVGIFYLFIRQINISFGDEDLNDEVETELLQQPRILDALVLFASITTALLISPNGFQIREMGGAPVEYLLVAAIVVLVSWLSFFFSPNNYGSDRQDDDVDPSQRLLELWDEKFEDKSK
jgi:hypothetical protein